jgi:hypothetical protein
MGTSTGYKAPTTPNWEKLKRDLDKEKLERDLTDTEMAELLDDFVKANEGAEGLIENGLFSKPRVTLPEVSEVTDRSGAGGGGSGNVMGGASVGGGARVVAQRGAAKQAAQRLGRFSAIVRESGFYEALRREGLLDSANKTPSRIVQFLVDYLAGKVSSHDDADCRKAASKTLQEIVKGADAAEIQERVNAAMAEASFPSLLVTFFANMLHAQFGKALYEHIARKVGSMEKAKVHHKNILAFIKSKLRSLNATTNTSLTVVQWESPQGAAIVKDIYQSTLNVFTKESA